MELTTPSCTTPQKTIHLCPMPGTKDMLWDEQDGIQSSSYPFTYAFTYAKYIYLCTDE